MATAARRAAASPSAAARARDGLARSDERAAGVRRQRSQRERGARIDLPLVDARVERVAYHEVTPAGAVLGRQQHVVSDRRGARAAEDAGRDLAQRENHAPLDRDLRRRAPLRGAARLDLEELGVAACGDGERRLRGARGLEQQARQHRAVAVPLAPAARARTDRFGRHRGHAPEAVLPGGQHRAAAADDRHQHVGAVARRRLHQRAHRRDLGRVDVPPPAAAAAGLQLVGPRAIRRQHRGAGLLQQQLGQVEAVRRVVVTPAPPVGELHQELAVPAGTDQHRRDRDAFVGHLAQQALVRAGLDAGVGHDEHVLVAGLHVLERVVALLDRREEDRAT